MSTAESPQKLSQRVIGKFLVAFQEHPRRLLKEFHSLEISCLCVGFHDQCALIWLNCEIVQRLCLTMKPCHEFLYFWEAQRMLD